MNDNVRRSYWSARRNEDAEIDLAIGKTTPIDPTTRAAIEALASEQPDYSPQWRSRPDNAPCCPNCNRKMIMKTARGKNGNTDFWGCPGYYPRSGKPKCFGTRPIR